MKVAVVYATDFGEISPGGIQNYLWHLGKQAPDEIDLTYIGMGQLQRPLPRAQDIFVSLGTPCPSKRVNAEFARKLSKRKFKQFDFVIFHRADNLIPFWSFPKSKKILFLHGGTANASKARRSLFNYFYAIIEVFARFNATKVYSVDTQNTWFSNIPSIQATQAPVVYDASLFNLEGISHQRPDFAIVGRLANEKQFDQAIKAFGKSNSKATLHVIGDGPERQRLMDASQNTEEATIQFHGSLRPEQISKILKERVGALLITSRFEGFPLAAAEAAACGCDVFSIDAPGVTRATNLLGGKVVSDTGKLSELIQFFEMSKVPKSTPLFLRENSAGAFWASLQS